jgi:hypothetical protein
MQRDYHATGYRFSQLSGTEWKVTLSISQWVNFLSSVLSITDLPYKQHAGAAYRQGLCLAKAVFFSGIFAGVGVAVNGTLTLSSLNI